MNASWRGDRLFTLCCVILACLFAGPHTSLAAKPELTFFGWSDQHVQTNGDGGHLVPAIEAMNRLPGAAYPDGMGGTVAKPAFVFGCGDITEWPTNAAKGAYDELLATRLKFPAYDVIGNHANRDALVDAFQSGNVILVLGGHYHQAKVDRVRGIPFVQLPSPAKNGPSQVMVVHITGDRLIAIPWSYRENRWVDRPGVTLDAAIPVSAK